jgi:hypothetical protein
VGQNKGRNDENIKHCVRLMQIQEVLPNDRKYNEKKKYAVVHELQYI